MEILNQENNGAFLTYARVGNGNAAWRLETEITEEELSFPLLLFEVDKCLFDLAMASGFSLLATE